MINPTEKDIGRKVYYKRDWMRPEDYDYGVITSFNDTYVFVRYCNQTHSKSTRREDLYPVGW